MARPRFTVPNTRIHAALPEPLVARLNLLLTNPLTGKPPYGALNKVIELSLQRTLRELETGETSPASQYLRAKIRGE